jgi:hypothetical protein
VLMGFGFPTGMRLVTRLDARLTPWLWGLNGAAGVLAAGLAVACSIGFSIDVTISVGGVCYALLLVFALLLSRMPSRDAGVQRSDWRRDDAPPAARAIGTAP